MAITLKARNRLEMLHGVIACEVAAQYEGCRAFAAIYPPSYGSIDWTALRIELPSNLIDEYFGNRDLIEERRSNVKSLDDAEAVLQSWGVDTALLDGPWKCDYPL